MNFLHEKTTFREIDEKRLNPNIGKMVVATTARFLHPGSRSLPAFAEDCARDVEQYINQNMGPMLREKGRDNLVTILLTVGHFIVEGKMDKAWMFLGLAARLITALQLNWDGAGDTPFEEESIRRAVWAIWKIDRFFAAGFEDHLVLRDEVMHLSFPLSDDELPEESGSQPGPDLLPLYIRLKRLQHDILVFTNQLAVPPTPHPRQYQQPMQASAVQEQVHKYQSLLIQFNDNLPAGLELAHQVKINNWLRSPQCATFFILHSAFWELHMDLHRFSIPGLREEMNPGLEQQLPREFVQQSRREAVGYAVCLARFWECVQKMAFSKPYLDGTEWLVKVDFPVVRPPDPLTARAVLHSWPRIESGRC